jgi:MoxR-like ATPase
VKIEEAASLCQKIKQEVHKAIVGRDDVLDTILAAFLTDGHILIEDYPGLAKTLMAKSLAAASGCTFRRVQFTPDLLPSDITGTYVYNQKSGDFDLKKGPVFTNLLLADEINRAPPKTQAALLEAMQERQVTLDGKTENLTEPFVVFATQNPIEYEGVYPLPEAQLDRFSVKVRVGYPSQGEEIQILRRRLERGADEVQVEKVTAPSEIIKAQTCVESVHVDDVVLSYATEITRSTRSNHHVAVGASPRGTTMLIKLARAYALLEGMDYVIPDHVKAMVVPCISHRLILKPESWTRGTTTSGVIQEILSAVPVPKAG